MSMSAAQARRQAVAQALEEAVGPVSAAALAERFSVSRQIIVGDIALLRAAGAEISATPRGDVILRETAGLVRQVAVQHDAAGMEAELNAMVDREAAWSAPWPVFTLRRRWSGSSTPSWTPGARWWT